MMIEVNLLPWREEQKKAALLKQGLSAGIAALLAFLILAIAHGILDWQLQNTKTRLRPIQDGLTRVNQRLTVLREMNQELNDQTLPAFDVNLMIRHQKRLLNFLQRLSIRLPSELSTRQMSLDGQTIRIEGISTVLSDILRFSEEFKASFSAGKLRIWQQNGLFHYQLRLPLPL